MTVGSANTHAQDLVYPASLVDREGWASSTITTAIAPLEFDLRAKPFADGFARALGDLLGAPAEVGVRRDGGFLQTLVDVGESSADPVGPSIDDFHERWLSHVRPATLRVLDRLAGAIQHPTNDQVASLPEVRAGVEELTYLHHTLLLPARAALGQFADFVEAEGILDSGLDALVLLAGQDNASTNAAGRIWRLRGLVHESPVPARILIDELQAVAQEGGGYGLAEPGWLDDPEIPLAIAWAYADAPLIYGPRARVRTAAERGSQHNKAARQRLAGCRPALTDRFEHLVQRARTAVTVTEDHAPLMHARASHLLRRFVTSLGEGLARQGRIDRPEAVLDLLVDELLGIRPGDQRQHPPRPNLRMDSDRNTGPSAGGALAAYIRQVFVQRPRTDPVIDGVLHGEPASPGKASGPVRRLRRHSDLGKVLPGDILVAPSNSAIWSFGLPLAAGVIAPGGSRLGHLASLARDYDRPAVVGLPSLALEHVEDGDLVHIDGDAGTTALPAYRGGT